MSSGLTVSMLTPERGQSQIEEIQALEYITEKNRPIICVWTRDSLGQRKEYRFHYRPYFFILEADVPRAKEHIKGLLSIKEGYKAWDGSKLAKITVNLPLNVSTSRDTLHSLGIPTWEADVKAFAIRWMVDHGVTYFLPPDGKYPAERLIETRSRVLYLDIEVVDESIVALSYALGTGPVYTLAIGEGYSQAEACEDEQDLLLKFKDAFLALDPDVIAGWNIHFDMRHICDRLQKYRIGARVLSPIHKYSVRDVSGVTQDIEVNLGGREVFDYARAYKELFKKELSVPIVQALDIVATRHLGTGKIKLDGEVWEVWDSDRERVIEYNRRDVELLQELEKKLELFKFFNDLRRMVGVRLRDVWYKNRLVDNGVFRLADFRLPTAKDNGKEEGYEGAYRKALPGLYKDMLDIDFQSFYPSIILQYNISPDVLENGDFRKDREGVIPRLLRHWLRIKEQLKAQANSDPTLASKYKAVKYVINAVYGQFGYPKSRLYNLTCASKVTALARQKVQELEQWFINHGYSVPYIDTDGLLVGVPLEEVDSILAEVNEAFRPLVIEKAHYFSRILVQAKTRYIGKTIDGEIVAKGMALIRADIPPYFSQAQAKLCEAVLNGASKEEVLSLVKGILRGLYDAPLWELGTPKSIRRMEYQVKSYHIWASEVAKRRFGIEFKVGDKPRILPIKGKERYIAITRQAMPSREEVDFNKLSSLLLNVLRPIYTHLGIADTEVLGIPTLYDFSGAG